MNELRFIGKIPGHLAGIRFKSQSLEYSLEYSHDDGGAELVVYRPREEDSEGITKIQEDCYSLYTEQGEEQDTVPFPIHSRCIELLRRLVKAYELTQDDIWRVFSKVSLGNNDIQKTDTFQENSIPDHDASKEKVRGKEKRLTAPEVDVNKISTSLQTLSPSHPSQNTSSLSYARYPHTHIITNTTKDLLPPNSPHQSAMQTMTGTSTSISIYSTNNSDPLETDSSPGRKSHIYWILIGRYV